MSKKRGLSLEEKRTRLLEVFFEKKEFFQLKELEKIAPKLKGITSMSVKDVLQSLVDDGMVDSDRIGTSNYFWAFPSKASNQRKRKLKELTEQLAQSETKRQTLEQQVKTASVGRENSDEREELLKSLEEKKEMKKRLASELSQFKDCDPATITSIREQTRVAVDATNRWTDNVFAVKSWCKNTFGLEDSAIDTV
jgi:predicted ArsR family transcriptional regulator